MAAKIHLKRAQRTRGAWVFEVVVDVADESDIGAARGKPQGLRGALGDRDVP